MKFVRHIILLLIVTNISSAQTSSDSSSVGKLSLKVIGIENDEGTIAVALSNSREDYESHDTVYRAANIKIVNKTAEYIFEDLPYGEYAIKVYHDEDDDGEIDLSFFGVPTEDYGFSNNASGMFGPADYDDAKFIFDKPILEIEIDIE
jgi:uncharacterized protein (DUF2141 family)